MLSAAAGEIVVESTSAGTDAVTERSPEDPVTISSTSAEPATIEKRCRDRRGRRRIDDRGPDLGEIGRLLPGRL